MNVSRRALVAGGAAATATALGAGLWGLGGRKSQPNVVLILTDDQGVSDVSCSVSYTHLTLPTILRV